MVVLKNIYSTFEAEKLPHPTYTHIYEWPIAQENMI